ncbi:hypothetical protein IW261DRAFT_1571286 [Armillaria novae-zelandiae]|uniref:JmjC domain-containing protein n=1 Tax=Armillaria novae-zelandiae TaxID=153914 RepID=A0AA39NUK4_9AGAR|nr:hypothetical protein IW261DRAFT_1571286 [Armillaria novae-zelandiae]
MSLPPPPPTHQMPTDDEGERSAASPPPNNDDMDSGEERQCAACRRMAVNGYKRRHPDATPEELDEKYPPIAVSRKKTRRQIEAAQKRDGETTDEYEKRLRRAEKKRQQRAAAKSQTPVPGPSKKERPKSQSSAAPKPDTRSAPILVDATRAPPSPPIDPVLLASEPPPAPPSRRISDFGVGALGVHPDAPTITWDRVSNESSPTPARVVLPFVPQDDINIVQDHAQAVCRHAQESPILEDTNEHVVFMCAPFPPDAELNDIIMDHLVHHRGVKLEGFYTPKIVEQLTTEYMATQWNVQPARVVEVHDTVRQKQHALLPFKKMLHSDFIDGLADPIRNEKILDVPMTHRGAPPPFGMMDDGYDAWNNTSSQYDWPHGLSREQWSDMNWGLLHHACTYTDEHHDADGKMTLIIGEQGSKLWTVTFPNRPLERHVVTDYFDQALQFALPTQQDECLCVSFTLVLLPGDLYFQPPGAIHAVYTPEPSFTRGASFWSLDTMHQVELSRRYDRESGMWSTNLDHAPERVYEGLVRMMLALPTNPEKLRYKRSLAAFLLMIIDPAAYIPSHARAYGVMIWIDGPNAEQQDAIEEQESQALGRVNRCPWAPEAVRYAKQVAKAIGLPSPKEIARFLQTGAGLSDPGEKISIAPVLREILKAQQVEREASERQELNANRRARPKANKPNVKKRKKI